MWVLREEEYEIVNETADPVEVAEWEIVFVAELELAIMIIEEE